MELDEAAFADFCALAEYLTDSWDLDPQYPMGRWVCDHRGYDREQRVWFACLYTNWYRLDSADILMERHPRPEPLPELAGQTGPVLPTKKERRCLRGNDGAKRHVEWLLDRADEYGGLDAWVSGLIEEATSRPGAPHLERRGVPVAVDNGTSAEHAAAWANIRHHYEQAPYIGSYASYKLCDLLKYWTDAPITAPNMGKGDGGDLRGPMGAIIRLTHDVESYGDAHQAIQLQHDIHHEATREVPALDGLEETETCLCNFETLNNGNYYVGKDIDGFQAQLDGRGPEWWRARQALFPDHLRGEVQGWYGVDNRLTTLYERTRHIAWWTDPERYRDDSLTREPQHMEAA